MDFGLHLANIGLVPDGRGLVRIAQGAEAAGFHSVWMFDHLFTPVRLDSPYPYTPDGRYPMTPELPIAEAVAVMAAVVGATERVHVGTRVLIPTYRHPVVLAKQLATIDAIAGGRLLLGVGAGWMAEEFAAVGVPPEERFARFDEHIALMRNVWQRGVAAFDGRFYSHVEAGFAPQPPRPGNTIPLIIGGHSDASLRRVARYGDGWALAAAGPALRENGFRALVERTERLRAICAEEGRDFGELMLVSQCNATDSVERIRRQAELGVTVVDVMTFGSEQEMLDQGRRFLDEVAAKL